MTKTSLLLAGATAALLGLSACGQQANPTADANAAHGNASAMNEPTATDTGAATSSKTTTDGGTETANAASAAPVAVVAPPPPAPDVPAAAAAPLTEAAAITQTIDQGSGVERIPYQGGWAWRQNGRIVRTASGDGRRVSYFRPGEQTPFLVQQDKQAVALSHGTVQRAYTPQGRPQAPDPAARRTGEQLARQAVQDRTHAADIARTQPAKVQKERPSRANSGSREQSDTSKPNDDKTPTDKRSAGRSAHDGQHGTPPSTQSVDSKTGKRDRSDPRNQADSNH